jgi:uncharacterized repeat protein (TIGR03803 family)
MKREKLLRGALWILMAGFCLLNLKTRADFVLQTLCEFPATNAVIVNATPQGPNGALIEANDGSFYGVAGGGSNFAGISAGGGSGTIFRVTKAGAMTRVFSFNGTNGNIPSSGLTLGNDGYLYGVTKNGGSNYSGSLDQIMSANGTIFKITTNGIFNSLFLFRGTNGTCPVGRLISDGKGNFYGTTLYGGNGFTLGQSGNGTVFRFSTNGSLTVLAAFNGTNGNNVVAGLTMGPDENLYGATEYGGSNYVAGSGVLGNGTLFRITTNGVLTTLVSFNGTNGSAPLAGLTLGPDNNFYGTTCFGGNGYVVSSIPTSGYGTVFQLTTNGVLTTILAFDSTNGACPSSGLTLGPDGNLYGSTKWVGTNDSTHFGNIFRITTNGLLTVLAMLNGTNGIHPHTDMILASDGNLYGSMGDAKGGQLPDGSLGSVFRLVAPPVASVVRQVRTNFVVSWPAITNAAYNLEYKTNVNAGSWLVLATNITGVSSSISFTDSPASSTQRFYRVRLLP